jgi:hypothetical protein
MKIRIVKPNAELKPYERPLNNSHQLAIEPGYAYIDTIEIDFDKIVYYMQENFIAPNNIDNEHDVRRIVENFINLKIGIAK